MQGVLTVFTPPTVEPIGLDEAKKHLRLASDAQDDDELILGLITTARMEIEEEANRALITQTLEYALDNGWPWTTRQVPDGAIVLPRPPLQSVTSVKYTDTDGAEQTLSTSLYTVNSRQEPARIVRAYNQSWPDTRSVPNAVVVRYVAGYGHEGLVPGWAKQAIKTRLETLYEVTGEHITGTIVRDMLTVQRLIAPHRIWSTL